MTKCQHCGHDGGKYKHRYEASQRALKKVMDELNEAREENRNAQNEIAYLAGANNRLWDMVNSYVMGKCDAVTWRRQPTSGVNQDEEEK